MSSGKLWGMTSSAPTPVVVSGTNSALSRAGRGTGTGPAVALVLGSCISLQFGAALAMQLFPVFGTWATTSFRLGCAALVLCAVARPRFLSWTRDQWKAVVAFGFALALMNGFFYASLARIPLGTAVSIEFLGPLLLAAILSRRGRDLIWVALALAGMAVLGVESALGVESLDPLGVLFALVAGGFWALYVLTSARVGQVIPGSGGLAMALVVAAALLVPFSVGHVSALVTDPRLLALALGTAILASLVPYTFELSALRSLPRPVFGILLSMEPVVASIAGWVLLDQVAGTWRIMAVTLVVAASIGSTVTAGRAVPGEVPRTTPPQRRGSSPTAPKTPPLS
ncbi:EamA family transporter [Kocuria sp.]|uniref:EamA family transporter n=1 Tax=Kocuria sp. TaxID=1871328 RepID=UPI0026DF1055|nr:DMT family transporter [Kocuria sp.]MDO5617592.1 DMT family transporter [Kocuria sp.]